jgi:hypothetical protein
MLKKMKNKLKKYLKLKIKKFNQYNSNKKYFNRLLQLNLFPKDKLKINKSNFKKKINKSHINKVKNNKNINNH